MNVVIAEVIAQVVLSRGGEGGRWSAKKGMPGAACRVFSLSEDGLTWIGWVNYDLYIYIYVCTPICFLAP